ncbi:hypothetical protein [Botrimarina sp.]|uniref:hypothetical protein n=1 Tax=Botrimarina sp. TaxID=2795802 RepID=UPI0032EE62B0
MTAPTPGPGGYDRPNRRWQCGCDDTPCSRGPDPHGRCPALGECAPTRDGDRWLCNRSPLRGGACPDGPTPDGRCCLAKRCRPRRSLRAIRGRWLRGAAVFTLGAVLMLLGAAGRNEVLAPGELTSHHAQVIARDAWANRCAACHPGANNGPGEWLASAIAGGGDDPHNTQSALCLDCHKQLDADGAAPLLAHGLPADTLQRRPASWLTPTEALLAAPRGRGEADALACAACHQEHHGAGHDLAAITDARCQACHAERFHSFATDHPDFGLWPVERRTRIAFNHGSHSREHYVKANRDFDCRACHVPDAAGDLTARVDYHAACGECHEADLKNSFGEGVDFLALPMIDHDALVDAGHAPPAWPDALRGDFDGGLPPFTKLLLAADPRAAEAMTLLGEDFSFFDVDPRDPQRVAAAQSLAEALRRLLDDLQEEGHGAVSYRIGKLSGAEPDKAAPASEADLVARLPIELVDRALATWFSGAEPPEPFDAIEDRRTGGAWSLDDSRFTLRYRPSGHDDPWLRAWLDAIAALPSEHAALQQACLAEFARPGAPGGCIECHSVERDGDRLTINWRGRDRLSEPRGFTRFSHRPHTAQPELADCTACHRLEEPAATPATYATAAYTSHDPQQFTTDLAPIAKAACTPCHRPHAAGEGCTQCHNYHVEPGALKGLAGSEPKAAPTVGGLAPRR